MLTREHLGVTAEDEYCDVTDPIDVGFYKNVWLKQASINTTVFDKVRYPCFMLTTDCTWIRNKYRTIYAQDSRIL